MEKPYWYNIYNHGYSYGYNVNLPNAYTPQYRLYTHAIYKCFIFFLSKYTINKRISFLFQPFFLLLSCITHARVSQKIKKQCYQIKYDVTLFFIMSVFFNNSFIYFIIKNIINLKKWKDK